MTKNKLSLLELKIKQRNASRKYYQKNSMKIKEKRKERFLQNEIIKAEAYKKILEEKIKNGEKI